jgi:ABC-2 type transport system permease protein
MNQLRTISLIAGREIKERGRSKAYLVTSVITVLAVVALIVLPGIFGDDTSVYTIGSVGEGNEKIVETAQTLGNVNDEAGAIPSVQLDVETFTSPEEGRAALEDGQVDVVLVDGSELIVEREGNLFGGEGPVGILQQAAGAIALEEIVAENGESAAEVIDIISSEPLEMTALVQSDEETAGNSIVAYGGLLLLYMAIILYGTWILTGVTEEKSTKVVEVLISTVRPWKLLAGKILGIGVLAMGQFVGTLAVAYVAIKLFADFEIPEIPLSNLANLIVWFILGFLLYAVLFGAAGSLVGRIEDAQSAAMPMTLFSVIGFFAGITVLSEPDGVVALITTLIPFTAPFVVPIRVSLDAIPLWQYGLSLIIIMLTIYFAVRVAGRIYSGGILRTGQRTKLREAWRSAQG